MTFLQDQPVINNKTEVSIVGAGPYGLAIAAHVKHLGIPYRIFGNSMQFWREMPAQMYLRSPTTATNIYTPKSCLTFDQYLEQFGIDSNSVCPISEFVRYGMHIQQKMIPDIEASNVIRIQRSDGKFIVTTDSEVIVSNRVVIAVGLKAFSWMPSELRDIGKQFVSHSCEHSTFEKFRGKTVYVIGAGQSALQSAALLHEAGVNVEVFIRGTKLNTSTKMPPNRSLLANIRRPNSGLGVGVKNWVIEKLPSLIWYLPQRFRIRLVKTYLGPSVAWWLVDRISDKFPIHCNHALKAARHSGGKLCVEFSDKITGQNKALYCDHLIAGTGFDIDIDRLEFLSTELRSEINRVGRSVRLDRSFQSSVPGLYFAGTVSALSFGPLFRFVVGARYTATTLASHIARQVTSSFASRMSKSLKIAMTSPRFTRLYGQTNDQT